VSEEDAHDDLAHRIITDEKYLDQFVGEPQGYCQVGRTFLFGMR